MIEEVLTTARYNPKVDPSLGIWTWEIAFYLFMGGMAAGIMLLAAWAVLGRRRETLPCFVSTPASSPARRCPGVPGSWC